MSAATAWQDDDVPPAGYRTQAADTSYAIERLLIDAWRRMPPWEKAARLVECCRAVEQMSLAGLRLRHPDASDRELTLRAAVLSLGLPLAREVYGPDLADLHI